VKSLTRRGALRVLACFLAFLPALPSPAGATIMREMSIAELSALSAHVVRGTILGQVSRWSEDGKGILTYVDVVVQERVKGSRALPDVIQIVQPGGELDGVRMAIVGGPVFREGEDLFLFLGEYSDNPAEADLVVIIGGRMGRLPVVPDPDGGEPRVLQEFGDLEFARFVEEQGETRLEVEPAPPTRAIPIGEFRRKVLEPPSPRGAGGGPGVASPRVKPVPKGRP